MFAEPATLSYSDLLAAAARESENFVVMTAENRAAIRDLPARLGPRFIDVGISEQTLVGAAAGLALRGRVVVAHALAAFLTMRAFEFIRTDVGLPGLPVLLVGAFPGFLSEANGPTHQALEDVALMRGIPGMQVFCPADEVELVDGMCELIELGRPAYVRYNACPPAVNHEPFQVGRGEIIQEGDDVTLLCSGFLLGEAVRAIAELRRAGISARLVNLRMLQPIDAALILDSAARTKLLVTIEDHFVTGGLASIVAELCLRFGIAPRVLPLGLPDRWFRPGRLADVLEHEGFRGEQLAARIIEEINDHD